MPETYDREHSRVECPYCQHKNDLSESIGARGEDVEEWDCGECGKTFETDVHVSISVTAREQ